MTVAIVLLLLALLVGGLSLVMSGLKWLLIIAIVLVIASFVTGAMTRDRART